uniref:Uncharacterized protein n=1 Tax=Oryza barthii TaxID=65489 RepID=A0A0D3EPZ8_9ORYZ
MSEKRHKWMNDFQEKHNSVANFLEEMNSVLMSLVKKQRINDPSMMNWSLQLKDAIDEVEFTRTARIVKESSLLFFSEGVTAVAPWARAMGGGGGSGSGRVDAPTLCCDQERCPTGWRRRQEREKRRKNPNPRLACSPERGKGSVLTGEKVAAGGESRRRRLRVAPAVASSLRRCLLWRVFWAGAQGKRRDGPG